MKVLNSIAICLGTVAIVACGFSMLNRPDKSVTRTRRTPVLVELFTSEGCSSCPSADALLMRLQQEQPTEDAVIIPLSEHVDYWNGAAWKDRFSSEKFTQRQEEYVKALHANGSYTPQMVVDGKDEFVGSDEDSALNSISNAAGRRKAPVAISAQPAGPGAIAAEIAVPGSSTAKLESTNEVYLVVTENNLQSHVAGGENGGRTLNHTAVVRKLQAIGSVVPGSDFQKTVSVALDPKWKVKDLSVVAFIQSTHTRHILGAAITSVPKS